MHRLAAPTAYIDKNFILLGLNHFQKWQKMLIYAFAIRELCTYAIKSPFILLPIDTGYVKGLEAVVHSVKNYLSRIFKFLVVRHPH